MKLPLLVLLKTGKSQKMKACPLAFYPRTCPKHLIDSVDRPLLLSKLKSYGFNDSFVYMLNSYLSDRYNRVRLGSSVTSGWKSVVHGCPQGSSLGPLIWNIFQKDLVYNINANISMYADDRQIYQTGKGISTVHTKFEVPVVQPTGTKTISWRVIWRNIRLRSFKINMVIWKNSSDVQNITLTWT